MNAYTMDVRIQLMEWQEEEFQKFQARLLPNLAPQSILGVRTPALKAYARHLSRNIDGWAFMQDLPHRFFEENQLHAFLIAEMKDFDELINALEVFLPYVDNWATCDQLRPALFKTHKAELLPHIRRWLASPHPYTVRFGLGMLMCHYLEEDFRPEYPEWAAGVQSEEYYVNMMIAWYFATALAKQYEAVLPYFTGRRLAPWVHNKAIQKAIESYRIPPEQKESLRGLKR